MRERLAAGGAQLVVPLIVPIASHFGLNPYHQGAIFLLNLEIGYLTPPFGLNLFISGFRFQRSLLKTMPRLSPPRAFRALIDAILAGDHEATSQRLDAHPELLTYGSTAGATRQNHEAFFIEALHGYLVQGSTILHIAAGAYQHAIIRQLLERGANLHAADRLGKQPLHCALAGGPTFPSYDAREQAKTIEVLIRAGADPNLPVKTGARPLHTAVRSRCSLAVQVLLSSGADPNARNRSGSTALHLAVQTTGRGGSGSDVAKEHQRRIIELLLAHRARPTDPDAKGKTVVEIVRGTPLQSLFV